MQTLWIHVSKTASLDSRYDFIDSGCSSCCPSYWPLLWPVLRRRQTGQTTTDKNSFLRRKFTFDSDNILLANLWKWRNRTNRDGAASDPNDPFGDIEDPSKQCLDINCYEPVVWDDGQVWNSLLWHLQTCCSCRRRCAGTGPRASASPGVRRFANRWTFQLFNLSLRHKCWVEGSETQHARHLFRTNSIAFAPSMYSIFWVGGLWRVQPGRIHGVHHRWDKQGAEGRPGGEKKISLRFWPTYTSGGGWGFHPADLWHQTHHYHWAQGEARVWKSGKGSRSSAYLQHARPTTENLATATFP